jgi:hypothetical protein
MEFLEVISEGERLASSASEMSKKVDKFEEKFSKFCSVIAGTSGHSRIQRAVILKEAEGTDDFPVLFGTVLERQLRAKYNLQTPDFSKYVKVGTQNDFRMAWDMATYGNRGVLNVVKERAEYKDRSLSDGKFVIGLQKYGAGFGLSWETVINDDLGAFSDVADDLVLSAKLTESKFVTSLYAGASGPLAFSAQTGPQSQQAGLFSAAGTHPIDGSSFANYKTTYPLTGPNLLDAITALKSQKDADGNPIMFSKIVLVVPQGKENAALQVLSNNLLIATALTSSSATGTQIGTTSENIITRFGLELVVNPWLDIVSGATYGPFSWYLFGTPASGDAIRFNRLKGHETPEVCQKQSDKVALGGAPISPMEGDFDSDSIRWRIRHILGGTTTDPRFAYGCQSTT